MYRQLWIAIIISTLLASLASLFASTISAQSYLNQQLSIKNADNAQVLALSLSQTHSDALDLELMVNALFDSGHYAIIKITAPDGTLLYERLNSAEANSAPRWFRQLFPLMATPGQAQISHRWNQIGTLTISSQTQFAYQSLWSSSQRLLLCISLAGVFSGFLASLILRRLQQPINAVIAQATAIGERRFIQAQVSDLPELNKLSIAMNTTVSLLQNMFSEEAERLEAARKVANTDQISGLSKRSLFMARLQLTLEQEDAPCSSLIFIRISHLAKINRLLGRDKTDALLQIIGVLLNLKAQQQEDGIAARLNGTEFALLFKGPDASYVAQNLLLEISEELASIENNPACVYLSYAQFEYGITLAELLSQLDSAVASAELTGYSDVRKAAPFNLQHAPKSQEQWSQLIHTAIERQGVKLVYFPVLDFAGKLTQIESALRLEFEDHWFPAGRFLAIAERLGLSSRLDLMAIELALAKLQKDSDTVALAVNISLQSMQDQLFRIQLQALLSEHSAVTARLCFEVPENGVFQQLDGFRAFAELVQSFACQLGIEHFGKQFHKITLLQDLHLSYVKIDGSLIREIQNYPEQLQYLKGLHSLVQKFGIRVYAEALSSEQEYTILAELGLDGATGPYIVCDLEE